MIIEGDAEVRELDDGLVERLLKGYAKYRSTHGYEADAQNWQGGGIWRIEPHKVFAWSSFPADTTRWTFSDRRS